jgi:hypothetical protein
MKYLGRRDAGAVPGGDDLLEAGEVSQTTPWMPPRAEQLAGWQGRGISGEEVVQSM